MLIILSQVTDTMRSKMKRGMEEFESLIFNKYFLMSVIYSLEKQRKFGLKDKYKIFSTEGSVELHLVSELRGGGSVSNMFKFLRLSFVCDGQGAVW